MKLSSIVVLLSALSLVCAPVADAAPKKSKQKTSKKTATKKPAKKAETPVVAPPKKEIAPGDPANHPEAYAKFAQLMDAIHQKNLYDLSPAYLAVLAATNDEFCIEAWMQKAADEGKAAAQLFMAQRDLFRVPPERYDAEETKKAVALLKKASDQQYAPAMQEYSQCMRLGIGTFKNPAGADRLLQSACRSGCFETRFDWLLKTNRLDKYEDLQRPEVKSEIERGNHHILHHMSPLAPGNEAIIAMLMQAANKGNGKALYEISELFAASDIAKSYQYLRLATRQRNADAMYRLGMYMIEPPAKLELNVGPVLNPTQGVIFLKLAALMGEPNSRKQLAKMYLQGLHGLEKNPQKAYRHTALGAAILGDAELLTAQGYMLYQGLGTPANQEKGLELLDLAASHRFPYAKTLLGVIYYKGIGVKADASLAKIHLEDAATMNYPLAFIYLALLLDETATTDQEKAKVRYYLDHAERAIPGKAKAIFNNLKNTPGGWSMPPYTLEKF